MIELMTSACVMAAMLVGQSEAERPAQILVDFHLIEVDLSNSSENPDPAESNGGTSIELAEGKLSVRGDGLRLTSMQSKTFVVADEATISVRGWRYTLDGANEGLDGSPFTIVSSPRILTLDGMPATVMVGQRIEYLEATDQESMFRVVQTEIEEGINFGITPRLRPDGSILLDPVEFRLREVMSRQPVEGLNLEGVGRPIIHTREQSTSVIVAPDETVVIPIMHSNFENQPLVLLVKARHWPDGKPNQPRWVPEDAENTPEESDASDEKSGSPE